METLKNIYTFLTNKGVNIDKELNLLIIGETGVGKSTFINAFANYFRYPTFRQAQKAQLKVLIPVKINGKTYGKQDGNECLNAGAAQTQCLKSYVIPLKYGDAEFNVNLIDTPGVGDPRGIEKDTENLQNILSNLATLEKLHGICLIMKANNTRLTPFFKYCLTEILSRLDKSASENIIFITTYSTTGDYSAGETKTHCLENIVAEIRARPPYVDIPLKEENTFAVDNEAFKVVLDKRTAKTMRKDQFLRYQRSWNTSAQEYSRLITYIIGDDKRPPLRPHDLENTISINQIRFLIEQLASPLAEVADLIEDNIRQIDRHKLNLQKDNHTIDQLKDQLYIPWVDLEVKELDKPVTVCTSTKCAEVVKVNNITKRHYGQRCHNPCYLRNVPKEVIGDARLLSCAAMDGKECCQQCGCSYKTHLHIYKETTKISTRKEDTNIRSEIKTKEDAIFQKNELIRHLDKYKKELEEEGQFISDKMARFVYFLQENTITGFSDAYKEYIKELIQIEKRLGQQADASKIEMLKKLLHNHQMLQEVCRRGQEEYNKIPGAAISLTLSSIQESIGEVYKLKHMGSKVQELIHKSSACRKKETTYQREVTDAIDLNQLIIEMVQSGSDGPDRTNHPHSSKSYDHSQTGKITKNTNFANDRHMNLPNDERSHFDSSPGPNRPDARRGETGKTVDPTNDYFYSKIDQSLASNQQTHLREGFPPNQTSSNIRRNRDEMEDDFTITTTNDFVVGIDLGTSKICVSLFKNGAPKILENNNGGRTTPCFIFFTSKKILFGNYAKQMITENQPNYGVFDVKRLVGKSFNESCVQTTLNHLPFKLEADGDSGLAVVIEQKDRKLIKTPQELYEIMLQKLKLDLEAKLGQIIDKVVITVPARFSVTQREATLAAAKEAGFTEVHLLNEPLAVALAYLFEDECDETQYSLVYSLGAGTFDVAILEMSSNNIQVVAVDGDTHLGGNDFDNLLEDYVCEHIMETYGVDPKSEKIKLATLHDKCEKAKKALSENEETVISLSNFVESHANIQINITREMFETLISDICTRTINIMNKCVQGSRISKNSIKEVILSGGSTRIPKIQNMVSDYFGGKKLNRCINPEEGVAEGAALKAAMLSRNPKQTINTVQISNLTSSSLALVDLNGEAHSIIKKSSPLPSSIRSIHKTSEDNQSRMYFRIYEGEHLNVRKNRLSRELTIYDLTPAPLGQSDIMVIMSVDHNGILTITAKEKYQDDMKPLKVGFGNKNNDSEIKETVKTPASSKAHLLDYCVKFMDNLDKRNLSEQFRELHERCRRTLNLLGEIDGNDESLISDITTQIILQCDAIAKHYNFDELPVIG